jgi:hypothetical protein
MTVMTLPPTPADHALFETRTTNFLGELAADSNFAFTKTLAVCFVSQGTFLIRAEVWEVDNFGRSLPAAQTNAGRRVVKVVVTGGEDAD